VGEAAAAAQVLTRTLPVAGFAARMRVMYVPRGPLLDWENASLRRQVLADLQDLVRRRRAIFIKIDPDLPCAWGAPGAEDERLDPLGQSVQDGLLRSGWRASGEQVQFRNSVWIDLQPDEAGLLGRMKQKTRYNVRLAERKGVAVRPAGLADLDLLYEMYAETSIRDGFVIRERRYYRAVWENLLHAGLADPLLAEVAGEAVAAVFVVRFARRAWYYQGMSRQAHREKMPNYLLQWEAMRRAKSAGCTVYDLWGAPDEFDENDPLWRVYRFKEGLGGQVVRTIGAFDFPASRLLYDLYTRVLPRVLGLMRRRGRRQTRRSLE
jgi:lipid II:glycine glycyltransferase (peptidoglycan interpeptide bridge formation enzyme)